MSSFSSVVKKPGKKIVPKAAPRRNVQRRAGQHAAVTEEATSGEDRAQDAEGLATTETAQTAHTVVPAAHAESELDNQEPTSESTVAVVDPVDIEHEPQPLENTLHTSATTPPQGGAEKNDSQPATRSDTLLTKEPSTKEPPANTPDTPLADKQIEHNPDGPEQTLVVPERSPQATPEIAPQPADSISSRTRYTQGKRIAEPPQISPRVNKRRKTTPRAAPELALSQSIPVIRSEPPPSSPTIAATPDPEHHDGQIQTLDDLLRSATERAASVSAMANTIESQIHLLRPRAGHSSAINDNSGPDADSTEVIAKSSSRLKRGRRKKTIEEQAAAVVANAMGTGTGSSKQRGVTPEDAANYELEPAKVTMAELCEDSKLGKKSALEIEMQENWAEILQRRKEDRERALANAEKRRRKGFGQKQQWDLNREPVAALAPAMAVVNGIIVVDQASREIDRSAQLQQAADQDLDKVREDRNYYKYVNQGTVGTKAGHGKHSKWDDETNERFFKGLRMFGTDFLMISNMFPGVTRKQIKTKFIREERTDKARVLDCLRNREPVELEDYAQMANKETEDFQTLESVQKDLDEEEKRLREEDNQRRKREGFVTTGDVEHDAAATQGNTDGEERQTESIEPGRFDSAAREIVEAAVAPKKRQRKTNAASNRRGMKGLRPPEGGVEEVLGSINEVAM